VAKDKPARIKTGKLVKSVYRLRLSLVHGGNKEVDSEYIALVELIRTAKSELISNKKFKGISTIGAYTKWLRMLSIHIRINNITSNSYYGPQLNKLGSSDFSVAGLLTPCPSNADNS
jgi:hypothetical protein